MHRPARFPNPLTFLLLCVFTGGFAPQVSAQQTLKDVRERGTLRCGVSEGLVGFSQKIRRKGWQGFDVDYCRAVAAAVFGDASKVEFVPLSATERLKALEDGKVDVLSRTTTWTMTRDVVHDLDFVGVWYFDIQGLMVNTKTGPRDVKDLNHIQICAVKGTTVEGNLPDFLKREGITAKTLFAKTRANARKYYQDGICKAYADDLSTLAAERTRLKSPKDHIFLSPIISKEPLGPVVRADDSKWRELLQWVLFALIDAEEAGWTSEQAKTKNLPEKIVVPPAATARLGLRVEWMRTVISQVGNYGEIFDRNLATADGGPGLNRGINALWLNGGLMYAPPMR